VAFLRGAQYCCRRRYGPQVAPAAGMWSQTLKFVTTRRHHHQPELTADVVVHFVLVLLLGLLIIWRF
jgi:hypothetical protein